MLVRSGAGGVAGDRFGMSRWSEIGQEKRCITCGEYWPADSEFFEAAKKTRDRLSQRCIACIVEKTWSSVLIAAR
jgi:hypothetical protein|eukprot:gene30796-38063_t